MPDVLKIEHVDGGFHMTITQTLGCTPIVVKLTDYETEAVLRRIVDTMTELGWERKA